MSLTKISHFESLNKCSVNVYRFDKRTSKVYPQRLTTLFAENHINLLLIKSCDFPKNKRVKHGSRQHFILIDNPSSFFNNGYKYQRILCRFCSIMVRKMLIDDHEKYCGVKHKLGIVLGEILLDSEIYTKFATLRFESLLTCCV